MRAELSQWTVPMVALVVLLVTAVVLVVMWRWVDQLMLADVEKKATAQLSAIRVASSIAVGGGGLFALYLAARRQRTQERELTQREDAHALAVRVAENTEKDAAARRVTELYAKSVEQLGSDKAPVRLGGLYALERLAQDNPEQRQTIINVMCAYLRMPYEPPNLNLLEGLEPNSDQVAEARKEYDARIQEREVRMTAQRILAAHLRPDMNQTSGESASSRYWVGEHPLDLTGTTLINLDLGHCVLHDANFEAASFVGHAKFGNATFVGGARFDDATFLGHAIFDAVKFTSNARFYRVRFNSHTSFSDATFAGDAAIVGAVFTAQAVFAGAVFSGVLFDESQFHKLAGFHDVTFSDVASFRAVKSDSLIGLADAWTRADSDVVITCTWPQGWSPGQGGSKRDGFEGQWVRLTLDSLAPGNAAAGG